MSKKTHHLYLRPGLVGICVYNCGDVCNHPHYGIITDVFPPDKYGGAEVEITPIECSVEPYTYTLTHISTIDSGNGSTRIVTAKAHMENIGAMARIEGGESDDYLNWI